MTHDEKKQYDPDLEAPEVLVHAADDDIDTIPTEEDLVTLRKVAAPMPFLAIAMCIVEFAERASYYGCSAVFFNFVNNPRPAGGSGTGAVVRGPKGTNQKPGALGLGLTASNAVTTTFTFLAYVVPIFGAIVADTKWGRFKTIWVGTLVGGVAHILLIIPAIPSVIAHPDGSLAALIISILILAGAAGFIKPSLAPLLCDQSPVKRPTIKVLKSGERVIVDPEVTLSRWLVIFYFCINVGGFFAIATTYASRFVGFWLAFFLPGVIYFLVPGVLLWASPRLYKAPPQGSVVVETVQVFKVLLKNGGWRAIFTGGGDEFWNKAKPSYIAKNQNADPARVFWDDQFVDEIRQSVKACAVFSLVPIFNLADGGIGNQLGAMSNAMVLNNVPNDLLNRFNPLAIIIFSPILTYGLYPFFQRIGRPIKPMTRMSIGFLLGMTGCIIAAVVQDRVYKTSPCGKFASECDEVSAVSLWLQMPIVVIPAIGELFVNVTSYEVAYMFSPARMKGLVFALFLFSTAISSAISLALADVIKDPNLVWPWVALAAASLLAAIALPTYFRHLNTPPDNFADESRQRGDRGQPGLQSSDSEDWHGSQSSGKV